MIIRKAMTCEMNVSGEKSGNDMPPVSGLSEVNCAVAGNRQKIALLIWALPLILALMAGLFTIDGHFIQDDYMAILHNRVVTQKSIPWTEPFEKDFWGRSIQKPVTTWRPLLPVIWRMVWSDLPHSPFPFRLLTALLNIVATGMVLLLSYRLLGNRWIACAAAALFAVNPIHAEAMGEVVGQADILATVLGLLALYLALGHPRKSTPFLVAAILMAACLAKESAVVFSALVTVVALMPEKVKFRKRLSISAGAALVTILTVFLQLSFKRVLPSPFDNIACIANGSQKIIHALYIIGRGMGMCFVPLGMSPYHDYAAIDLSPATLLPYAIPGALFLGLGILAFAISLKKRSAIGVIGVGLLLGPLVINSSLIASIASELAERLLYPASAVAAAITAFAVYKALGPRWRNVVFALLILFFSVASWSAQRPWRKNVDLYTYAVKVEPLSVRLNQVAGFIALRHRDADTAAWRFMVITYILRKFPERVDSSPIMALKELPVGKRVIAGPSILAPQDTCGFLADYFEFLDRKAPHFAPLARKGLLKAYPACAGALSRKTPENKRFRQIMGIMPVVLH